jgi:hypothetical protein
MFLDDMGILNSVGRLLIRTLSLLGKETKGLERL